MRSSVALGTRVSMSVIKPTILDLSNGRIVGDGTVDGELTFTKAIHMFEDFASPSRPYIPSPELIFGASMYDSSSNITKGGAITLQGQVDSLGQPYLEFRFVTIPLFSVGYGRIRIHLNYFDSSYSVTIAPGDRYRVPVGMYYVILGTNVTAMLYDLDKQTWYTIIGAGGRGLIMSDGNYVWLKNNSATASDTAILKRVL